MFAGSAGLNMKKLPTEWKIPQRPVSPAKAGVKGKKWRITVLTESLLRLEYAKDGLFEDRATQFALNRDFTEGTNPQKNCFHFKETDEALEISTSALNLRYDKKPFSKEGLSVTLKENGFTWHYGDIIENLGGTVRTLDRADGSVPLDAGLLSRNGITVVDDSLSLALDEDGWPGQRAEGGIDLYVFAYGKNYRLCIKDFYHLTGAVPLLPRYALGNWWSRFRRYSEDSYKELIERFQKEQIPFSVSVLDMDWHITNVDPALGGGWTGFTWNRELFPDPKRFLAWLHGKNMRVTLNLHPADGIRSHEEAYKRIAARLGIEGGNPAVFDAADHDFLQAYFEEVLRPLENEGVDFWWIDWQQGTNTNIPGLDPLWVLNHFHYLDSSRGEKRALIFSRYAGLGSHRYTIGFSGDTIVSWASLDFQPYFTSTASNAGYPWWSHDIGGHMGGIRDDELSVRWVQLGVFSPINRLHSNSNQFNSKEPWHFNKIAQTIITEFLRLRHRLIPYLYTMNRRTNREGEPLIQPLYYAEPENENAYQAPNEFYFGSEMIVCPMTTPIDRTAQVSSFNAWIPPGIWIDFFNGCVYSSEKGRMFALNRGLEYIPVLVKAGGIIPLAVNDVFTNSPDNPEFFDIMIFAGANGKFSLWEDSGDSNNDNDDDWALTEFILNWDEGKFLVSPARGNLSVIPENRAWNLHFCGFADTEIEIFVDDKNIPAQKVYDVKLKRLSVSIGPLSAVAGITVELKKCGTAKNDVYAMLFEFLDNAWIDFELKQRVFDRLRDCSSLKSLEISPALFSGINEILFAE